MCVGLTAYALFAGADFGAGFWDLFAGDAPARGARRAALIEHSIGPVWEANHVWLIFVLVVLWTGFPPAFAAIASTLYIPLTLARARHDRARVGVRVPQLGRARSGCAALFGACFAFSSRGHARSSSARSPAASRPAGCRRASRTAT